MTRLLQLTALALSACACAATCVAQGEAKVPSPAVSASRPLVEQKLAFVKRVLADSPAAKRSFRTRRDSVTSRH